MQIPEKKKLTKRPEVRSLKIQPHIRINGPNPTTVTEIRLCGNWLGRLGFSPEQRVAITTMNRLLIIRLEH